MKSRCLSLQLNVGFLLVHFVLLSFREKRPEMLQVAQK